MSLVLAKTTLPAMSESAMDKVRQLEHESMLQPQVDINTDHLIHAGMYARTIMIPEGVMLTGVHIIKPTTLIVSGACVVYLGEEAHSLVGYHVLAASANRKQVFVAVRDTYLTMLFPTSAESVEEAEREFTDEFDLLMSHHNENHIRITGE